MKTLIIIPAHNEEAFISQTLDSLLSQTLEPDRIIVVDDNSTDATASIVASYASHGNVSLLSRKSSPKNIPGSKVVQAFNHGLAQVDWKEFDIICKFDADLVFPKDYMEQLVTMMSVDRDDDQPYGMVAGHCSILKNGQWIREGQNNPDHIRGALKAYHIECFEQIGGLKESIGWDTVDEMLARFYGWEVVTIPDLYVKHLKPTGAAYQHEKSMQLQGEAFYKMRYGWRLTLITAAKMAWNKKKFSLIPAYIKGYQKAKKNDLDPLVTVDQGQFIRSYRWQGIRKKIGL
ncbi:glycosyltransferase family 2 protein [Nonlabens xiamenensis]|uniref:glycosyltransferase family 2 protein n=1 Tax=Nonlabens xiamenensis TaxID=2341043 RepID=UPI000F611ED6|nr:glycosyltransferase family A protein [Nonlabens xiamenensis]